MQCRPGGGERINSYAVVSYIPGPLGSFLDRMRRELVPSCFAHAHVTILPPRPLSISNEEVTRMLQDELQDIQPFRVELTPVEMFVSTSVVYLGIGEGHAELKQLHEILNKRGLLCQEPFYYHPHVTLAQDLASEPAEAVFSMAERSWAEYPGPKYFDLERLTFVQNTTNNSWLDLADFPLGDSVLIGNGAR